MTRGQGERSNSLLFGSFTGNHFYAMMFQSDEQADADKLDSETPRSLHMPRSAGIHTIQIPEMGQGVSTAAGNASITEELQHASDMAGERSISEGSESSAVRVDLRDVGEESYNFTTSTLRKCKMQVLKPYWGLLMFVGWRVFRRDVITPKSWKLKLLNFVYPLLIIMLLLYTYMYEMVACEWKLNVIDDTVIATSPKPSTITSNITATAMHMFTMYPAMNLLSSTTPASSELTPPACDHIVTTYLIPNILHFIAYIIGLYYFRIQDSEQMDALMEKVFLQANPLRGSSSSQKRLITKTRLFLAVGSLWVLLTLLLQGLYVWAFDFPALAIFETYGPAFHWITFAIELLGRMVFNSVLLAVVINYGTQCEMVMFYVKGLTLRLQEKSVNIKTAFKDTLLLRQHLSLLNGTIAKMTTLALVIMGELTVIGLSILILNRCDLAKVWVYRAIFPCIWAVMLSFPLFQAARLNSVCLRIKKIALEMRVFGYLSSSQLELDSFLQFVHFNQLRAKLFHIPILPSYIIALSILVAFIFLILIQTSLLGTHNNVF